MSGSENKINQLDSLFSFMGNAENGIIVYLVAFLLIFFLLCLILIPLNIYFAQRHARLCRDELRKQTIILENILSASKIRPRRNQHEEEKNPYEKEI
jgi:hypothetical protein